MYRGSTSGLPIIIKEQLDRILVDLFFDFIFALRSDAAQNLEHQHYVRRLVSALHHERLVVFLLLLRLKRGLHVFVARMGRLDFAPRTVGLDHESVQRQFGGHLQALFGPQRAAVQSDIVAKLDQLFGVLQSAIERVHHAAEQLMVVPLDYLLEIVFSVSTVQEHWQFGLLDELQLLFEVPVANLRSTIFDSKQKWPFQVHHSLELHLFWAEV